MCLLKQLCPHEVPQAIESADLLSFIDARDGVMPQDIHLDSFAPGWSFLTAQEHDQELLIMCNGFELVTIKKPYFPIMCWAQRQDSAPFGQPAL